MLLKWVNRFVVRVLEPQSDPLTATWPRRAVARDYVSDYVSDDVSDDVSDCVSDSSETQCTGSDVFACDGFPLGGALSPPRIGPYGNMLPLPSRDWPPLALADGV